MEVGACDRPGWLSTLRAEVAALLAMPHLQAMASLLSVVDLTSAQSERLSPAYSNQRAMKVVLTLTGTCRNTLTESTVLLRKSWVGAAILFQRQLH